MYSLDLSAITPSSSDLNQDSNERYSNFTHQNMTQLGDVTVFCRRLNDEVFDIPSCCANLDSILNNTNNSKIGTVPLRFKAITPHWANAELNDIPRTGSETDDNFDDSLRGDCWDLHDNRSYFRRSLLR